MSTTDSIFSEVRAEPLSDVALRLVREAIVDGRLAPGVTINQVDIAKQLGISRAPLREAMRGLEQEGLVQNVPFRGTIVTPLTPTSIHELQSLRRVLEVFAAEQALSRASDADLKILDTLADEIARYATAGDFRAVSETDIRLHSTIVELSGHGMLNSIWTSHVQQIRRAMSLRNRVNQDLTPLIKMHRELVDAFLQRDLAAISRCYDVHGSDLITELKDYFRSNGSEVDSPS